MASYGPDLDEGLPKRSVLRTVAAAALATQPARGSVTQPHNRDGNLGRPLIQRSRWHTATDVTAGHTASQQRHASRAQCGMRARSRDRRHGRASRPGLPPVARRPSCVTLLKDWDLPGGQAFEKERSLDLLDVESVVPRRQIRQ
jgi:hypothetical protein